MALRLWIAGLLIVLAGSAAFALEPDEILLIANGNAKESREFAEYYAKLRKVPAANLVLLDVRGGEEIPRDQYISNIAVPVREFLAKNDPTHKIKCLLTFYGVPIRVANRAVTPDESAELKVVRGEMSAIAPRIGPLVRDIELLVKEMDPAFRPPTTLEVLPAQAVRVDRAVERLVQRLNAEPDPKARRKALERLFVDLDDLTGPSGLLQRAMFTDLPAVAPTTKAVPATLPSTVPTTQPAAGVVPIQTAATQAAAQPATEPAEPDADETPADRREIVLAARQKNRLATEKLTDFARRADDPKVRQQMRDFAKAEMGLITYARVLENHIERLEPGETNASVDNELALVLWGDHYPLYRWIENPLNFRVTRRPLGQAPVMMVMRLDAANGLTVRNLMTSAIKTEEEGLTGKFVIDSRGIAAKKGDGTPDAYGEYDENLRNLAALVKAKTQMPLVFDEQPAVLPPHSVKDVALYCGWYALRNYLASCDLRPGAVGFHVASLEMVSIHQDGERGWVKGLLEDGIVGTCGAVAEPYLHSFPKPDEFFPLLMTGELTLAEVYWKTCPLVSWQVGMIGDPLYRPFKRNPQLKREDLPGDLRAALRDPAPRR